MASNTRARRIHGRSRRWTQPGARWRWERRQRPGHMRSTQRPVLSAADEYCKGSCNLKSSSPTSRRSHHLHRRPMGADVTDDVERGEASFRAHREGIGPPSHNRDIHTADGARASVRIAFRCRVFPRGRCRACLPPRAGATARNTESDAHNLAGSSPRSAGTSTPRLLVL